jgi:3-oxoacyl-[acyl-carrier protein] reductase
VGRLDDRVAIVTGGAGYLGRFHALHLASEGAAVVIADIGNGSEVATEIVASGGRAIAVTADVADEASVKEMVDATVREYGRIDVLVNNAAIVKDIQKPWTDITADEWRRNIDVDLTSMFLCSRAVFPTMKDQSYGRIINISSGTVVLGFPNFLHYVSAKSGVVGFSRALASEVGEDNITVNTIMVGLFPHDLPGIDIETITEQCKAMQAIKRVGKPEDLSAAIAFFASAEAGWITGQAIAVDGGLVRTGG